MISKYISGNLGIYVYKMYVFKYICIHCFIIHNLTLTKIQISKLGESWKRSFVLTNSWDGEAIPS